MQKEQVLHYLRHIKSELNENGIEKIGLFGSFAQDRADTFSDIDIAIKIKKSYLDDHDVWEYFNLIEDIKKMLLRKFSRKIDVFDLDGTGTIGDHISSKVIYV